MSIVIDVRADFSQVRAEMARLERGLRDAVTARALNKIGQQVKTAAKKEISAAYNITQAKVAERITVRKAMRANPTVVVAVESKYRRKSRATNLITFGARELKRGGVSVKIRRDAAPLRGDKWFIITNAKTQGRFVAKRTGRARKDIASVMTIDVGQMFNARKVNTELLRVVRERFPTELKRALASFKN